MNATPLSEEELDAIRRRCNARKDTTAATIDALTRELAEARADRDWLANNGVFTVQVGTEMVGGMEGRVERNLTAEQALAAAAEQRGT